MQHIIEHIRDVRRRIEDAALVAGRRPGDVRLVAVSKTRPAAEVRVAHSAGVSDFGENYVQEGIAKISAVDVANIRWHFIGAIQSNKTRDIATHFDWVQTVDRPRIAQRLARDRPPDRGPLNVLLQVNIDAEPQKAGVHPDGLAELIAVTSALPTLRLRGLMAIPRPDAAGSATRQSLARMAALFRQARAEHANLEQWDTLSMGMTNDFELAIAEGATMVRIGTGVFGTRMQ
jgi:PLP dependent protein